MSKSGCRAAAERTCSVMLARRARSASQLAAMGLDELIANDFDDYARIAINLLADRARLASITEHVRSAAARQPLFDMQRYAQAFTRVIFEGWRALAEARAGRKS